MKIELDYETARGITLDVLKDTRKYLKKELKEWRKNPKTTGNPDGVWMHPEDVGCNEGWIVKLTEVIEYFGGE